jgi:hypothetical protein
MNNFFRFCVFGVILIIPRIISARVFTLEQILSSLKDHISAPARTDVRQAPFQAVLQTRYYPYSEREIDGGSGPVALNGGQQPLFLPRHRVQQFLLLHHQAKQHVEQQLLYPPPAMKNGVEQDSALKQWQAPISQALPMWNQRQSPIVKVYYGLRQSVVVAWQRKLLLVRELINAYYSYLISKQQNPLINLERLNADDLKG